jgi:ribosomal protein L16 Arg81 hydroxylase
MAKSLVYPANPLLQEKSMTVSEKPALNALLSPRSLAEFADCWPDKIFAAHGEPARLPEFLRARELSSIGALSSVYRGRLAFCSGARTSYMVPGDPTHAQKLFQMGLTLFFHDLGPYVPGAEAFLRQLETELGLAVGSTRMTAWASPREDGAACHYDANDIISIQLFGDKRFELAPVREIAAPYGRQYSPGTMPFEDLYTQTANGFPDWRDAEFQSIDMRPGSVLFFPRGTWHRTFASADSLAVAIVVEPPPAIDCFLHELRLVLLQDPRWRRPLYGAWGNGEQRRQALAQAEQLLRDVPRAAAAIAPQDMILPTINQEHRLELIEPRTRFQRVPNTSAVAEQNRSPEEDGLEWLRIRFKDEHDVQQPLASVEVPRQYNEVLVWLMQQHAPFSAQTLAEQFPSIPFDELKHLLQTCTRGGLLKLLAFPANLASAAPPAQ